MIEIDVVYVASHMRCSPCVSCILARRAGTGNLTSGVVFCTPSGFVLY